MFDLLEAASHVIQITRPRAPYAGEFRKSMQAHVAVRSIPCSEQPSRQHTRESVIVSAPPLGDAIETFIRREEAERFVEEVRGDDPDLASYQRIEARSPVVLP